MINKTRIIQVLLAVAVALLALPAISAADPGNFTSLDASVQATEPGGILTLDKNYTYDNETDTSFAPNGILVTKELVVDGNGHTFDAKGSTRIFNVGDNAKLTLKNLIIRNTINTAIYQGVGSELNVINCTFTNCSGDSTFIRFSTMGNVNLRISNSTFSNSSGNNGIAFGNRNTGTFEITGSKFINNIMTAPQGTSTALIYVSRSNNLVIRDSTFIGNTGNGTNSAGDGACIVIAAGGTVNMYNCTFIDNYAGIRGSAISSLGTINVYNSTFTNNTANTEKYDSGRGGGAIYSQGSLNVSGSKFIDNTAGINGGAIYSDTDFSITNSTFIGNFAENGGAINGKGTISNSIFSLNDGINGTAIHNTGTLTANNNWWGTNTPDFSSLIYNSAAPTTWIYMNLTTSEVPLYLGDSEKIDVTADFNYYTDGTNINPITDGTHIPDGLTVYFRTDNGQITVNNTTVNGLATGEYSYIGSGIDESITATVDANPNSNDFTEGSFFRSVTFNFNTLDTTAPTVTVDHAGGTYNSAQTVTLTSDDPTAVIYYTTDGSNPTTSSAVYSGPIVVSSSMTLKYIAVDPADNQSDIYVQNYVIDTVAPIVTVDRVGGTYNGVQTVTLISDDPTAVIYYTKDGSNPTKSSAVYSGPILVSSNMVLKYFAVDPVGNPSQIYTQNYVVDTVAPKVTSVDPANNVVNVSAGKTIKVTFSEAIKKGSNFLVVLKNSAGKSVSFKSSISSDKKTLYIDPVSNLAESLYTLVINKGAVIDLVGNPVVAISTKFSVGSSPKVSKVDPANNAVKVSAGKTIKVTFSEAIKKGSNLLVVLKNSAGKSVSFKSSISSDKKTLYIDPVSNLAESLYTLVINKGAVTDLAGNPVAAKTIKFSVGKAPTVSKVDPKNSATKVARNKTIKVTFNENIKKGTYKIVLKNNKGQTVKVTASISGKVLSIKHSKLAANTKYTLYIYSGSVTDKAGNPVAAKTYSFTTGST